MEQKKKHGKKHDIIDWDVMWDVQDGDFPSRGWMAAGYVMGEISSSTGCEEKPPWFTMFDGSNHCLLMVFYGFVWKEIHGI